MNLTFNISSEALQTTSTIWLHISNSSVMLKIMKYFSISESAIKPFRDTTFRANSKIIEGFIRIIFLPKK